MNGQFMQRLFWGMFIVALGVGFLMRQFGLIHFDLGWMIGVFWPVILILIGLQNFFAGGSCRGGGNWWGAVMVLIGFVFLGRNLGWIGWSLGDIIRYLWPVAIIVFGLSMIMRPRNRRRRPRGGDGGWKAYGEPPERPIPPAPPLHPDPLRNAPDDADRGRGAPPPPMHGDAGGTEYGPQRDYRDMRGDYRHHKHDAKHDRVEWWNYDPNAQTRSGFIGDIHIGQEYWELKPLNISHFIGDTVLDLTKAQIPPGETKITISTFIGDVKVFVPNDYEVGVQVSSSAFLGDASVLEQRDGGLFKQMSVESPYYHEMDKKIRLVCSTFIGDVRVTKVG